MREKGGEVKEGKEKEQGIESEEKGAMREESGQKGAGKSGERMRREGVRRRVGEREEKADR